MVDIEYELKRLEEGVRDNSTYVMVVNVKYILQAVGMNDDKIRDVAEGLLKTLCV